MINLNIHHILFKMTEHCNLHCKYCNLDRITELPIELNTEIYKYIYKITKLKKTPLELVFSGGEPLLYFDIIKNIVSNTKNFNVIYNINTNGFLLTEEIINFLNQYNFIISISWDGRNSKITRGENIFDNKELKDLIFKSKKLKIMSTLTPYSYPLDLCQDIQELANEYKSVNPNGVFSMKINELIDFNIKDRDVILFNYNKIKEDVECIMDNIYQYLDDFNGEFDFNNYSKIYFLLDYYINIKNSMKNFNINNSDIYGFGVIAMDLGGNLLHPNNPSVILGNITDSNIINYLINKNKFNYSNDKKYNKDCLFCMYKSVCNTSKTILMEVARRGGNKNITCNYKKIIYETIIKYLK